MHRASQPGIPDNGLYVCMYVARLWPLNEWFDIYHCLHKVVLYTGNWMTEQVVKYWAVDAVLVLYCALPIENFRDKHQNRPKVPLFSTVSRVWYLVKKFHIFPMPWEELCCVLCVTIRNECQGTHFTHYYIIQQVLRFPFGAKHSAEKSYYIILLNC